MPHLQSQLSQIKTIALPREEYKRLKDIEKRFERMREIATLDFFEQPPLRSPTTILSELKKSGKYTGIFLKSIKRGLEESDYFSK